jgi:hypothetical protein
MNDKTAMDLMEDHANALIKRLDVLAAELAECRIERQREHDLRVKIAGEAELLAAELATLKTQWHEARGTERLRAMERDSLQAERARDRARVATLLAELAHYTGGTPHPAEAQAQALETALREASDSFRNLGCAADADDLDAILAGSATKYYSGDGKHE